jgi:hypothetical protein
MPSLASLDATNIEEAFDDILLDLTLKGEKPDVILCGRNIFRLYRAAVPGQGRSQPV